MATVNDISNKTGYSASTVASVLRGAKNFKNETQKTILNAAEQLDYQPNWLSKALAGATKTAISARMEATSAVINMGCAFFR